MSPLPAGNAPANSTQLRTRNGQFRFGVAGLLDYVMFLLRVRRERRLLMSLDDAVLKDLGLNRSDAYREARRGLLDLPEQDPADRRRQR